MTDKCLCINTFYSPTTRSIVFEVGEMYEYTNKNVFYNGVVPIGYFVRFNKDELFYFRNIPYPETDNGYGLFSTHFKPLSEIRKEKIKKIKNEILRRKRTETN